MNDIIMMSLPMIVFDLIVLVGCIAYSLYASL